MPDASGREFRSTRQVLEAYIPDYKARSKRALAEGGVEIGSQLATDLIEEFRSSIRASVAGSNQTRGLHRIEEVRPVPRSFPHPMEAALWRPSR